MIAAQAAPQGRFRTVDRAVRAIVTQQNEPETDESLGARLGVSSRHLRRLFQGALGITPDELRRFTRASHALRLLQGTDLSITEVAFAAGFGSLQTFNRTFAKTFHTSPLEVRHGQPVGGEVSSPNPLSVRLRYQPPLAWNAMLDFLAARAIAGVESVSDGAYRCAVSVGGRAGALELAQDSDHSLRLRLYLLAWDDLVLVVEAARNLFGLDAAVAAAARQLAHDPVLGRLADETPGVRPPGTLHPLRTAVSGILGERLGQISGRAVHGRLAERLGEPLPGFTCLGLSRMYPTAEVLKDADLGALGVSPDQAASIRQVAAAGAAQPPLGLGSSGDRALLDRAGGALGRGTAAFQYLALRLGEPDAFPWNDRGLQDRLEQRYGSPLSLPRVAQLGQAWRPWRAHAATILAMAAPSTLSEPPPGNE
ncbi:MAG: AlkA N-terminal domain-containing protein [Candidatus Dormibacteria bacterium]